LLKNELKPLQELSALNAGSHSCVNDRMPAAGGRPASFLEALSGEITGAWSNAVFSNTSEQVLARYFTYHARGLSVLLEQAAAPGEKAGASGLLPGLAGHLYYYYRNYIDPALPVPELWLGLVLEPSRGNYRALAEFLERGVTSAAVKGCLLPYLEALFGQSPGKHISFGQLNYLEALLRRLMPLTVSRDSGDGVISTLIACNFNHLGFFAALQQEVLLAAKGLPEADQLELFQRKASSLPPDGKQAAPAFDPLWPSLAVMLKAWLQEEIGLLENKRPARLPVPTDPAVKKVELGIPVTYLACLIRVFQEEGIFAGQNLSELFRLAAGSLRTRRQPVISAGSLSKEFYGTSQVTAAKVQGLLQRMITHINRLYFPK
jgi:hypothetical protein